MSVTPHVALGRGARAGAADTAEAPLTGAPARDSAADGASFSDVLAGERREAPDAPSPAPTHERRERATREAAAPDAPAATPALVAATLTQAPPPTIQHNEAASRGDEGDGGDSIAHAGDVRTGATDGADARVGSPASATAAGRDTLTPTAGLLDGAIRSAAGGAPTALPAHGMGLAASLPRDAASGATAAVDTDVRASDGNAQARPQRPAAATDVTPGAIMPTLADETAHTDGAMPRQASASATAGTALESHQASDAPTGPRATTEIGAPHADNGSLALNKATSTAAAGASVSEADTAPASSRGVDPKTVPGQGARNTTGTTQGQATGTADANSFDTATASRANTAADHKRGDAAISRDAGPAVHVRQSSQQGDAATSANGAGAEGSKGTGDDGTLHVPRTGIEAHDGVAERAGKAGERGLSRCEMADGITAAPQENAAASTVGRGVTIDAAHDALTMHGTTTSVSAPPARQAGDTPDSGASDDTLPPHALAEALPAHERTASKPAMPTGPLGAGLGEPAAPHPAGDGMPPAQAFALLDGEARQGAQVRAVDEPSPPAEQGAVLALGARNTRDSGPLDGVGRLATALRASGMVGEEHQPHVSGKSATAPENAEAHASAVPLAVWLPALVGVPVASAGPARPTAPSEGDSAVAAAGGAGVGRSASADTAASAPASTRTHTATQARQPDAWAALLPGGIRTAPHEHAAAPVQSAAPTVERTVMTPIGEGIFVRMGALRATPSWSSFHVVLQPQALGMVTVHMERSTAGLHVSILPQHAEAQALLDKHLPELVAQLRAADPDGSLRVNVLPVNLPAPQHNAAAASAVQPAAPTPDSGAFSGQGAQTQLGGQGQGFDQGHPPPEWRPPETAQARPAVTAATAAPASRSAPKGRIATARTARIDVQA